MQEAKLITLEDIKENLQVQIYMEKANEHLGALGFTEHGFRHSNLVAKIAYNILSRLGYPEREAQLAGIAGYLHDIGNVVSRYGHAQTGANICMSILERMGMPYQEIAEIVSAIGNHDEKEGRVVNPVSAVLILADKSDVHRSRVRNPDCSNFDIHDRVNFAVQRSFLRIDKEAKMITLELVIDPVISQVMEYFEIFLSRMVLCRRAAAFLDTQFSLVINDTRLL